MLDQNDVQIIKELFKEGIKPLEEKVSGIEGKISGIEGKISGIEGKVSGIEKEMVKKSEFKDMFKEAFTEAMEPYAIAIKMDFNNLEEKMSGIEILIREIKATEVTETDLSARLNRLNTEFSLISREERGIIIQLLKEKKIITEEEAHRIMSIKIPINQS